VCGIVRVSSGVINMVKNNNQTHPSVLKVPTTFSAFFIDVFTD